MNYVINCLEMKENSHYKVLSQEKIICEYCSKPESLFNINRHLKSKSCQKFKAKYLKVNKNRTEEEFELFINEAKQRALNKDLFEEEDENEY